MGALHVWGVHVMTGGNDSRLEGLLATTVLDRRGLGGHSVITGLDVADAPALSGGGPQSVPSRISVVLVDEVNAGGTPRRECPRDDQDRRSLAGVAKPASVTVYDDSLGSPCVGGDVVLFLHCREAPSSHAY